MQMLSLLTLGIFNSCFSVVVFFFFFFFIFIQQNIQNLRGLKHQINMILTKLISECRKTLRAIKLECTTFREGTCSVVVKATNTDKVDDNEK